MDAAPLILAHTHARNAILETQKTNAIAASEEHDLAAGEFATAASITADSEATRILRLLEQHHQKLAEILKIKPEDGTQSRTERLAGTSVEESGPIREGNKSPESNSRYASPRVPPREMSSSIVSNLASARGISHRPRRGQQAPAQLNAQNVEGRVLKPARRSNLGEHELRVSMIEEKAEDNRAARRNKNIPPPVTASTPDDPFSRFYSTFGNLISTLSAPLAFAGLPLNTETAPAETTNKSASPVASRVAADPDLARYFSKAALRAVRDERGGFNPSESFYVVPPTGGQDTYAKMLSGTRQNSNITEDDDLEFVDASETPQPPSPGFVRHKTPRPGSRGAKPHGYKDNKTWEEMMVENETLRAVVLDLGERLRAFELGAQRSSRALHASMRGMASPTSSIMAGAQPPIPGTEGMRILQDKLQQSEEELKTLRKENKRLGRENSKFMGVIERYRERWEALKEGARERGKTDAQVVRRVSEVDPPRSPA